MSEIHIVSCVVRTVHDCSGKVLSALERISCCQVYAQAQGKLVVVLEGTGIAVIVEAITAIRNIKGVLSVELAYQHAEEETAMREIMP